MDSDRFGSRTTWFYYASCYNLPKRHGKGAAIARALIPRLERATGASCSSRWPFDPRHDSHPDHTHQDHARAIAIADAMDLARADFVIAVPLTATSRGTHVEMGLAIGLGKDLYLFRPASLEGTAFDALTLECPKEWVVEIVATVEEFGTEVVV